MVGINGREGQGGMRNYGTEDGVGPAHVRLRSVWSLTQLYSVDFSQSTIGVKSAFSTIAQGLRQLLLTVS